MNVGGEVALKIVLEEFLNLHRGQGWYVQASWITIIFIIV